MKELTYYLALVYHFFKRKSPIVATGMLSGLFWLQTKLVDPVVLQEIIDLLPQDTPSLIIKLIKWAPAFLMSMIAPHTKEIVARGVPGKYKQ